MPDGRGRRSPQELVAELRARGMSVAEIAGELERDPKMVRKVLSGQTAGEAYRETLTQLVETGRATIKPARRRARDGHLVPVRAKTKNQPTDAPKLVTPDDHGGRYVPQPKRWTFKATTSYGPAGTRLHEVQLPKTPRAKGREKAREEVMRILRSAAKGQARKDKRAKLRLTFDNGRTMDLGAKSGYDISDLLARARAADQNPMEYLMTQTFGAHGSARYVNFNPDSHSITGVSVTVYEVDKK